MVPGLAPPLAVQPAGWQQAVLPTLKQRRKQRAVQRLAALPPEALEVLPTAAAAAAAASFLMGLGLCRAGDGAGKNTSSSEAAGFDAESQPGSAMAAADPPASVKGIWAAAWRGFALPPVQQQQQQKSEAAGTTARKITNAHGAAHQLSKGAGQREGRQRESKEDEAAALEVDVGLRRAPVLLLQGIRSADRSRLLALCLAALEAQASALPAGAGLSTATVAQWRQLSAVLLVLSSVAAAAAWLGYVPYTLLAAAAKKLRAADPVVLQAASLQGAAATLHRQAAAAAAAAAGLDDKFGSHNSKAGSSEEGQGSSSKDGEGGAVDWYCLGEKLQLYSSVVRLLTCSFIEQEGLQQAAAAGLGLPAQALETVVPEGRMSSNREAVTDVSQEQQEQEAGLAACSGDLARSQALLLLRQQQEQGSPLGGIRGWRATAAGTRSDSQLLALAPTVLQDMAVTAADAVAAAYLADAATAGPTLTATTTPISSRSSGKPESSSTDTWHGEVVATVAPTPQQQEQLMQQDTKETVPPRAAGLALACGPAVGLATVDSSSTSSGSSSSASSAASSSSSSSSSSMGSGSPLESGWWPTFVHAQLGSTRQLQRFANQVALNRWVERNYHGVADIYEDRLRLFGIGGSGRALAARTAPLKRMPELGQLEGLRYAASLLLEAVDLLAPLLGALWRRATSAASWLLVRVVGEAAALVRRGLQLGGSRGGSTAAGIARAQQQQQQSEEQRQQRGGGAWQQQQQEGSLRCALGDAAGPGWAWQP